jgi:PLP dependent protein
MKERIKKIKSRIGKAAMSCDRDPKLVRMVAASKTVSADDVKSAITAGIHIFGENYIQEAIDKIASIADNRISWHFIGHLQSNKAKYAVRYFDLIHSVDSIKLAKEINKQAKKINKIQKILVQVNISMESTKSGVAVEDAVLLIKEISRLENISVIGLMTMPPYFNSPEKVRPYFKGLVQLKNNIISENIPNISMDELSMGMTGDFEAAVCEGSTLVRIGTAIFGERS